MKFKNKKIIILKFSESDMHQEIKRGDRYIYAHTDEILAKWLRLRS